MNADLPARVLLADGEVGVVRTLGPGDADAVLALHTRLDERDRYFRFFGPLPSTMDRLAGRIAGEPGEAHAGLGCFLGSELAGVAHYERRPGSAEAEIALVVDGTHRAQGIATLLLEHLAATAHATGIDRFVAEVLAENAKVIKVFSELGLPYRVARDGAEWSLTLWLDADHYPDAVAHRDEVAEAASLAHVLNPDSIVVIGVGRQPGSIGRAVLANLLRSGYPGHVEVVHPHASSILEVRCATSIAGLSVVPELAVVCLPAEAAANAVEECGSHGVRAVVMITSGLTGTAAGERVRKAVREHGMRLVGPNCLGVVSTAPSCPLDVTFLERPPLRGGIGIATQSGGVGIALTEALTGLGLGVSALVSTGDKYDVSGNDLLLWWASDRRTQIVVLYLESFGNPRKFSRLAARLARTRPVLAVRAGSGDTAQRAAASHTAAVATPAVTRDALYEQAGIIAVDTVSELVDVIAGVSWQPLPRGRRVAVVSNAGGAGVLAADACEREGLTMACFSAGTVERLSALLPAEAAPHNPVDTTAAAPAGTFGQALRTVLADEGVDAVLVATVPTAVGDPATVVADVVPGTGKTVFAVQPGQQRARVAPVGDDGAPVTASYDDPAAAAAVLGKVARYAQWLDRGDDAPELSDIDAAALRTFAANHAGEGDGWLSPPDASELLRLAGLPLVTTRYARDELEAIGVAGDLAGRLAVKADAQGLQHKSRGGGVLLEVYGAGGARDAYRLLQARFGPALRGVAVQPMVDCGRELLVGVRSDPVFGPLVVFGLGGVDADLVADHTAHLAPLTGADADLLLDGLRSSEALWASGIDRAAVREVLLEVARLAVLVPELAELDLNPLAAHAAGCVAVDVRVRLARRESADPFLRRLPG
ncbi:GNAT family N-acetyltransferase [Amycolatopsis sp. FDAARGOS 1241]|uniref:bifunctional acetate--CoA ligase family protein/GNAT family N-acetyltransferase n=1 Tax=Amycolatopsis sp. FDAARGOS 1241 TaxID=2778070 RepID=UPI0019528B3D|nr:GNAT family N-acetyltransferase [Amycolatopsis sp. FDAARGOS 1241]QRP42907.1 GNAT family N-acetyltransferase [Amycolatopsis sp. FDAARGOS 1241]